MSIRVFRTTTIALIVLAPTACFDLRHPVLKEAGAGASGEAGAGGVPGFGGGPAGRGGGSGAGAGGRAPVSGASGVGMGGADTGMGGGEPGGAPASCQDLTAELCMSLTWPAGLVPYERGADLDDEQWAVVESALGAWHGAPILSQTLEFSPRPVPGATTLLFTAEAGCGVIRRSGDALVFALQFCNAEIDVQREIGVALGIPRWHQRTDRDRYLEMAPPSAFDCTRGQFFDKCPVPAEFGLFSTEDLMFAAANSTLPPGNCALEPDGSYLYIDRRLPSLCELSVGQLIVRVPFPTHHYALAELYATLRGWQPFRPIGRDRGEDRPLELIQMGSDVPHLQLGVSRDEQTLILHGWANDTNRGVSSYWQLEGEDGAWGDWHQGPATRNGLSWAVLKESASPALHVFAIGLDLSSTDFDNEFLLYTHYEGQRDFDMRRVGARPPAFDLAGFPMSLDLTLAHAEGGNIGVYAKAADGRLYFAESDTTSVGDWHFFEGLPSLGAVAAVGTPGEQHAIGGVGPTSGGGVLYLHRDARGWSEPTRLFEFVGFTNTTSLVAMPDGELHAVFSGSDYTLWHTSCAEQCSIPTSWTGPTLIARASTRADSYARVALSAASDHLDLVAMSQHSTGATTSFWHKQWWPLRAQRD